MVRKIYLTGSGVSVRRPDDVTIRIGYTADAEDNAAVLEGNKRPRKLEFTLTPEQAEEFAGLILAGVTALRGQATTDPSQARPPAPKLPENDSGPAET